MLYFYLLWRALSELWLAEKCPNKDVDILQPYKQGLCGSLNRIPEANRKLESLAKSSSVLVSESFAIVARGLGEGGQRLAFFNTASPPGLLTWMLHERALTPTSASTAPLRFNCTC